MEVSNELWKFLKSLHIFSQIVETRRKGREHEHERLQRQMGKEKADQILRAKVNLGLLKFPDLSKSLECGGCPFYATLDSHEMMSRVLKSTVMNTLEVCGISRSGEEECCSLQEQNEKGEAKNCKGCWDLEDLVRQGRDDRNGNLIFFNCLMD